MFKELRLSLIPGIIFCLCIAIPAWIIGQKIPIVGSAIIAIVIGIILATLCPDFVSKSKFSFPEGLKFTSKKLLQLSIILLGFEMNFFNVIKVGGQSLSIMIFTILFTLVVAFVLGKAFNLPGNTSILIGVGTSICGGSAIAATAPVIKAGDDDVARAISTIFLFNIIAVFIFPALGNLIGLSDQSFGIWAGTAINDTSSVVAASSSWSIAAGNNTALQLATIVKLTRTLMIIPITLILAIYLSRKQKLQGTGGYSVFKIFPWFVLLFVLAAIVNTIFSLPVELTATLAKIGKFMIVMAMASIGLSTNIKSLFSKGYKPILLGFFCWVGLAVVSLLLINFIF